MDFVFHVEGESLEIMPLSLAAVQDTITTNIAPSNTILFS